jgi:hypothetical protein
MCFCCGYDEGEVSSWNHPIIKKICKCLAALLHLFRNPLWRVPTERPCLELKERSVALRWGASRGSHMMLNTTDPESVLSGRKKLSRHRSVQGKANAKFFLCLISQSRNEDVWGSGGIAPPFLTSALDGGEWSASCAGRFSPEEKSPWCLLDRSLRRLQNPSGRYGEEKKILCPCRESNPSRPARRHTDSYISAPTSL